MADGGAANRAIAYVRVSTSKQADDGNSISRGKIIGAHLQRPPRQIQVNMASSLPLKLNHVRSITTTRRVCVMNYWLQIPIWGNSYCRCRNEGTVRIVKWTNRGLSRDVSEKGWYACEEHTACDTPPRGHPRLHPEMINYVPRVTLL